MTPEDIIALGIPVEATVENAIAVESGLAWIAQNTTFVRSEDEELPANIKLFLAKFAKIICRDDSVASESIAGMSQSFSTGETGFLLRQYAEELLSEWYTGGAKFIPAVRRWA